MAKEDAESSESEKVTGDRKEKRERDTGTRRRRILWHLDRRYNSEKLAPRVEDRRFLLAVNPSDDGHATAESDHYFRNTFSRVFAKPLVYIHRGLHCRKCYIIAVAASE